LPFGVGESTAASIMGFSFGGTVDIIIDAPDVIPGKGWLAHTIVLHMADGRVLRAGSARPLHSELRTGLVDPQRFSEGLEYQNKGLVAPTSGGASLRHSDSGGLMWRICYVTDALKSVKVTARLWPNKADSPGIVVPTGEGIVQLITARS
jgi:hypothetical protein